jgi:predicted ATPase
MKSLRLVNFKAFTDRTFDLKPLTLLSGLNSTGKSCLLQSLLLLQQSYQQRLLPDTGLALNGDLVSIGTGRDALNESADSDIIGFETIEDDDTKRIWRFQSERDADVLSLLSPPVIDFPLEIHYLSSCVQSKPLDFDLLDRLAPGIMVLLEHPEHRLHPSLAAKLGEQIARAAARGVQIIVETHNDHLFNGIRVAVHGGQIKPEAVGMFYFQTVQRQGRRVIDVASPRIDRRGRIDRWADGFFDQFEKNLEQLLEPINV